jgi:hypothetical protein
VEEMIDDDKLEAIILKAIEDNITITDSRLYAAVYAVAVDVADGVVGMIKEEQQHCYVSK